MIRPLVGLAQSNNFARKVCFFFSYIRLFLFLFSPSWGWIKVKNGVSSFFDASSFACTFCRIASATLHWRTAYFLIPFRLVRVMIR